MKYIILGILISNTLLFSQQEGEFCSSPEADQFNFWVGEWECSWGDEEGNLLTATNSVKKILGSCVVEESFIGTPAINLIGKSHSVFDAKDGMWKQTWVDNSGGYLDFTGNYENDKMILSRKARKGDKEILQRMVWYDIKADEFLWNWESSQDEGETWQVLWKLEYRRKSPN